MRNPETVSRDSRETSEDEAGDAAPRGDALGSTAYSERFVLRLLLRLADGPPLSADAADALETQLCTLWDMAAERDVALFLLRHGLPGLLLGAWEQLAREPRLAEVAVGLLANLCCFPEALDALRAAPDLCAAAVRLIHSDDSPLLIQVLRLLNACLYGAQEEEAPGWLARLSDDDFVPPLAFILTNSSNKDLLLVALENLNTICSKCNVEATRAMFFDFLVKEVVVDGLHDAFEELTVNLKNRCETHELERVFLVTLEITSNLNGFDKASELYKTKRKQISNLFTVILKHYNNKIVEDKQIDPDFVDIVESINTIAALLQMHQNGGTEECLMHFYNVWTAIRDFSTSNSKCDDPSFEEGKYCDSDTEAVLKPLREHLCCFMSNFVKLCPEDSLHKCMEIIEEDFEDVLDVLKDDSLSASVRMRIAEHATALEENK